MTCAGCGHANPDQAKFCLECGAALGVRCAQCGTELPPAAKFCLECGARTAAAPPPAREGGARKVVSIVFADLVGSTALHERLDAESARRLMERYYAALRGAVDAHGGTVVKLLGDGVMAAFGIRQVAEDDAERAVRAAAAMQTAFRALVQEQAAVVGSIGLRVAVNTGEVVVSGAHDDLIGDPVNVAARLQEKGGDGDVVVGEDTHRLVATRMTLEPLGSLALKGRAETVDAYRLVSLDPPAGAAAAPFVGRAAELGRLDAVFAAVVGTPATRLAVLLGSPGLGKSRLIDELARRHDQRATLLSAHCDAGGGATFAPLATALRAHLGLEDAAAPDALRAAIDAALHGDDADRARVAAGVAALLAGSPAAPEETFFVVRRFLAALAGQRPVLLVIDDLHWAEPLLLDLVEHLVQWGAGVPLFVLVGARPELRDLRAPLAAPGGLVADVVTLAGLDAGAAMRLAANVIGAADLPAAVAAKVLATSEGNPLFVGELVRMLVQEGALTRDGERWTVGAGLAELEMPPTIHALLAARIERLRPPERQVLERAAVIGRHFSRGAVAALLPRETADLDARIEALRRGELIERDSGWLLGEPALRFHHVLIRDAAYRRLLKETRAELHGRLADWIEAQAGEAAEHDETIGRHLEQAHVLLAELGPLDPTGRALGTRAAARLAAAGRRALAGDDVPLAATLLGRAIARLDAADPARAELALDWCEALLAAGDVAQASGAIDELGRFADEGLGTRGSGLGVQMQSAQPLTSPLPEPRAPEPRAPIARLRSWHTCFAGQLTVLTEPAALQATADALAAAAAELTALGDAAGEAKAHSVHAQALARLGRVGACEAALDRALAAARKAGDRRRANAVLAGAPVAALWGPSPVTRASGRCLDVVRVLRITQGAPAVEAVALSCQGVLEALRGRTDAARRMLGSARKMVEELGIAHRLHETDAFAGRIAAMEGDAAAAEPLLRGAYDGLRELGLGIDAARAGALLARVLLAQDRAAEAEALSHESEALAGDDLQAAIAWRGVRAEALARRGEHAAAIELAQAAVGIATATDALLDHADARLALAAALRAAGRGGEADAEQRRAVELWEAKGATLLAERVRHRQLPAAQRPPGERGRGEREGADPGRRDPPGGDGRPDRGAASAAAALAAAFARGFAAGDEQAVAALWSDALVVVDHPTGASYGRAEHLDSLRRLRQARDPWLHVLPLGALGAHLVLCRRTVGARGAGGGRIDVADWERVEIVLFETAADGRCRRVEIFTDDRLGDAVARLFARHAECLPAGAAAERAAAIARSVTTLLAVASSHDLRQFASALSPMVEAIDHRRLGLPPSRGAAALIRDVGALFDLAADVGLRSADVLRLEDGMLLQRALVTGTDRNSGGAFELPLLLLWVFDDAGLLARWEVFDAERETEARARVDALGVGPPPRPVRRVRANAAAANGARIAAAVAAADLDGVARVVADAVRVVHHPTGTSYGRPELLETFRLLLRARGVAVREDTLATLGETLALAQRSIGFESLPDRAAPFGAVEADMLLLEEIDGDGRLSRIELFAADHLGAAIVRLYERHAELLPEGAARERAALTARAAAYMLTDVAVADVAPLFSPTYADIDHRSVGYGALSSGEAAQVGVAERALADQLRFRIDDILDLRPDGLVRVSTTSGVWRDGGGAFERTVCRLSLFGADGRATRQETFDADRAAEALARFDALTGSQHPSAHRRIHRNAATAALEIFAAVIAARDGDRLVEVFSPSIAVVHHPTGVAYGQAEMLTTWRSMFNAAHLEIGREDLATLGDDLALVRHAVSIDGLADRGYRSFGPAEVHEFVLTAVGADGRVERFEIFAADRLGAALTRLYALYAERLPNGPTQARAAGIARSVAACDGPLDLDALLAVHVPSAPTVDHRVFATWSAGSATEVIDHYRRQLDLAPDFAARYDDVVAAGLDVLVARMAFHGTARDSGGPFENRVCVVMTFDAVGRIASSDVFEAELDAAALARVDASRDGERGSPAEAFANAASRSLELEMRYWAARDWDGLRSLVSPAIRFEDRRGLFRAEVGFAEFTAQQRMMFDQPRSRWIEPMIATRGERLSLHRVTFEAEVGGGGGPLEIENHFVVVEVDADGRWTALVLFDADDEAAAFAELDRRYAAGEGDTAGWRALRAVHGAIERRDWAASTAAFAPRFAVTDRRRLGWGPTLSNAEMFTESQRSLVELAPDVRYRFDHVRASPRGYLTQLAQIGTRDGGPFESPFVYVATLDASGRPQHFDLWDVDGADAAVACYRGLTAHDWEGLRAPLDNTASRADRALFECFNRRDWPGIEALGAPELVFDERRRMLRNTCGRDLWLAQLRVLYDVPASRFTTALLATRGERLSLSLHRFAGDVAGGGGPLSLDGHMALQTVDGDGRLISIVLLDLDDRDAAYAELDARYAAGEATAHPHGPRFVADYARCFAARDWSGFARVLAPDLVAESHRLTGWGTVHGPEALVATMRTQIELAPDTRMRMDHVRACAGGALFTYAWQGTREGGEFENLYVVVAEIDASGRPRRIDVWEHEQLDQAVARFAALRGEAPADSLAAFAAGHPATAVLDRWRLSTPGVDADWAAIRASLAPGLVFEDRQGFARLAGDGELMIASLRERMASGARVVHRVEGTAGARVAIARMLWSGGPRDGRFEIEYLGVTEVDAAGLVTATILFAAADGRAARREAWARWVASEPALAATVALVGAADDAFNAHDRGRLLALFAGELVVEDHRRTGMGRIEGAAAYADSLAVLWELSPDTRVELAGFWLAADAGGGLFTMRRTGNVAGGGPFESDYLMLLRHARGGLTRMELYELDQREAALASWAALAVAAAPPAARQDPLRIPPNAAARALDGLRWGDAEALRAQVSGDFIFEDRGPRAQVRGGIEQMISGLHFLLIEVRARLEARVVATAGDRLVLRHLFWRERGGDPRFAIERWTISEVDDAGRLRAMILYDLEQRAEASDALFERYAALGADGAPAASLELMRAWNAHDLARVQALLPDDFYLDDHRRTGVGRLDGADAYVTSLAAMWELSRDLRTDALYTVASAPHGRLFVSRWSGTNAEGGEFDAVYVCVGLLRRDRPAGLEIYELDDLDAARARFEALRP